MLEMGSSCSQKLLYSAFQAYFLFLYIENIIAQFLYYHRIILRIYSMHCCYKPKQKEEKKSECRWAIVFCICTSFENLVGLDGVKHPPGRFSQALEPRIRQAAIASFMRRVGTQSCTQRNCPLGFISRKT
jgi:hypothetical protein